MKPKYPFKVGDLVRDKANPELGTGKVWSVHSYPPHDDFVVVVNWPNGYYNRYHTNLERDADDWWCDGRDLEIENPIQRMKRRYEEEV